MLLAGIGGQGIQVAGKTLAHAAVYERKRALYYSLFDGGQRRAFRTASSRSATPR